MAQGRLAASGRISEMVAFQLKGWELVASGVTDDLRAALAPKVRRDAAPVAGPLHDPDRAG